jgi:phage-related minor tail protein
MALAVLISSIALLLSALASIGTYRAVKRLESQITPLVPQVVDVLAQARVVLDEGLKQFHETGAKTQAALDEIRAEVREFGVVRAEVTTRLRTQMTEVEEALDGSLENIQEVVSAIHGGVIRPIREVTGWAAAIRTAVSSFLHH